MGVSRLLAAPVGVSRFALLESGRFGGLQYPTFSLLLTGPSLHVFQASFDDLREGVRAPGKTWRQFAQLLVLAQDEVTPRRVAFDQRARRPSRSAAIRVAPDR